MPIHTLPELTCYNTTAWLRCSLSRLHPGAALVRRAEASLIQRASGWFAAADVYCHGDLMGTKERRSLSAEEQLSPEERAWLSGDQRLRDEARALADRLGRDADDIYRALRQLRRTPAERLRLGLRHARLHPKHR